MDRVDGDDVRVLELGQGELFPAQVGAHLQDNEPIGQIGLTGEKHASEGASTELARQVEIAEPAVLDDEIDRGGSDRVGVSCRRRDDRSPPVRRRRRISSVSHRPEVGGVATARRSARTSAKVVAPKYGMQIAWSGPARWTE